MLRIKEVKYGVLYKNRHWSITMECDADVENGDLLVEAGKAYGAAQLAVHDQLSKYMEEEREQKKESEGEAELQDVFGGVPPEEEDEEWDPFGVENDEPTQAQIRFIYALARRTKARVNVKAIRTREQASRVIDRLQQMERKKGRR